MIGIHIECTIPETPAGGDRVESGADCTASKDGYHSHSEGAVAREVARIVVEGNPTELHPCMRLEWAGFVARTEAQFACHAVSAQQPPQYKRSVQTADAQWEACGRDAHEAGNGLRMGKR